MKHSNSLLATHCGMFEGIHLNVKINCISVVFDNTKWLQVGEETQERWIVMMLSCATDIGSLFLSSERLISTLRFSKVHLL